MTFALGLLASSMTVMVWHECAFSSSSWQYSLWGGLKRLPISLRKNSMDHAKGWLWTTALSFAGNIFYSVWTFATLTNINKGCAKWRGVFWGSDWPNVTCFKDLNSSRSSSNNTPDCVESFRICLEAEWTTTELVDRTEQKCIHLLLLTFRRKPPGTSWEITESRKLIKRIRRWGLIV